jgi:hypothetical protein
MSAGLSHLRCAAKVQHKRAAMAADCGDDTVLVFTPTTKQFAKLFGISVPTLKAAQALSAADRERVRCGHRPLVTTADRVKAATRRIGADTVLDLICDT